MTVSPSTPPASTRLHPAPFRTPLGLVLATLLCLLPFVHKAVHLDDYLFLRSARQILEHPLDPFGTMVNWYGVPMPLASVTQNPPGACYYLAAVGGLFGWGEIALHLAMLVPALAAVLGTWALARRLCPRPGLAALLALLTPVFWISATTLMCDMLLLACWVWAVECWWRGLEQGRRRWLVAAALLAAAATLTKYFGVALIPLLLAFTLVRERRFSAKLLWLLVPLLALAAYEWTTHARYGHGMLAAASAYIREIPRIGGPGWRMLVALSFTGGCLFPALFFTVDRRAWRPIILGLVAIVGLAVLLHHFGPARIVAPRITSSQRWWICAQMAVFVAGGLVLLGLAAADLRTSRSADSLLLFLWVAGTFVFTALLNWAVNGRSILPMAPALAILAVRRFTREAPGPAGWRRFRPLLPAALLGGLVVYGDARCAEISRTGARLLHERLDGRAGALWFQGHWGFQYYMEAGGARALDRAAPAGRPGDYVVVPSDNTAIWNMALGTFTLGGNIDITVPPGLATMQATAGAGFYADAIGPLPFAIDPGHTRRFFVARLRTTQSPQ